MLTTAENVQYVKWHYAGHPIKKLQADCLFWRSTKKSMEDRWRTSFHHSRKTLYLASARKPLPDNPVKKRTAYLMVSSTLQKYDILSVRQIAKEPLVDYPPTTVRNIVKKQLKLFDNDGDDWWEISGTFEKPCNFRKSQIRPEINFNWVGFNKMVVLRITRS